MPILSEKSYFNLASHRSIVQLSPPTGNIHWIKDDCANSKIEYSHGTILRTEITCKKIFL